MKFMKSLQELRDTFERLFVDPFASHCWASERARSHWVQLEGWQDAMAGPLCSIVTAGGCEYVYSRDDDYFAGVSNPSALRSLLLGWHGRLTAGVEQFIATTPQECNDLAFMQRICAEMRELVERACAVEQARWDCKGGSNAV